MPGMERPRLLLLPEFTELEWVIKPELATWAEVATYDRPGIGDEPLPEGPLEAALGTEVLVNRGLAEIEKRGWSELFVAAEGWSADAAVRVAQRHRGVRGLALGHAALTTDTEGDRPAINRAVWEAFAQLIRQDYASFVQHGIGQLTAGSYSEELAERMIERFPMEHAALAWQNLIDSFDTIEPGLRDLGLPLLFAKHEGCLMHTDEGWEDAVAAFPEARTVICDRAPCTSPDFARALRAFCQDVVREEAQTVP
jgi:hypothetical protein